MSEQTMGCVKVLVLCQMSQEHKICKCISYVDLACFCLVNSWISN